MKCDRCGFDNGSGTESGKCMGCGIPIGPGKDDEKKYPFPTVWPDEEPLAVQGFWNVDELPDGYLGLRAIQQHQETWEDGVGANPWSGYRVEAFEATFRIGSPAHKTFGDADADTLADECPTCGCHTARIEKSTDGGGGWSTYISCVSCDHEFYGESGHAYL